MLIKTWKEAREAQEELDRTMFEFMQKKGLVTFDEINAEQEMMETYVNAIDAFADNNQLKMVVSND